MHWYPKFSDFCARTLMFHMLKNVLVPPPSTLLRTSPSWQKLPFIDEHTKLHLVELGEQSETVS